MANWLDKYEQGGLVLKKKTKDNFGKKFNPNDVQASVGPGFVGDGYNTKGRNYSPAWGGQFQDGGNLWNTNKTAWVDSIHNARKGDLNFVQRMFDQRAGSIQIPGQRGTSTHFMESGDKRAYPTVVQMPNGKLQYLNQNDKDAAWNYAKRTKQFIQFPTDEQAEWYANDGYKKGTGVLEKKQMGGSLPGAVGFTYARTQNPAPSNGKYAKKTLASAQDGKSIQQKRYNELYYPLEEKVFTAVATADDYDRLPHSTRDFLDKTIAGFSVASNRNIPPMDPIIKEVQNKIQKLPKEELTKLLNTDWSKIGLAGAMKNTPSSVSYLDMLKYVNHFNKLKKKGYTLQNGGEMKFYQEGLDFQPKSISKNGSVIKDDMGQWAHPGEITEIGSNEITMKGVNYPVLGVSDTGDTKLMQPGKDYKFKGTKVTEYPKGGWLNKYK